MLRFMLLSIVAGVLAALLGLIAQKLGHDSGNLMPFLVAIITLSIIMLTNRHWPPAKISPPPTPDNLHWHYLGLAGASTGMVGAAVLLKTNPDQSMIEGVVFMASVVAGLWFASRQNALQLARKNDPSLFDERAQANQRKSEKWAFLVALETALILGLVDFLNIASLSGAFVGFSAGAAGIFTGMLAQAWLEWRDTR